MSYTPTYYVVFKFVGRVIKMYRPIEAGLTIPALSRAKQPPKFDKRLHCISLRFSGRACMGWTAATGGPVVADLSDAAAAAEHVGSSFIMMTSIHTSVLGGMYQEKYLQDSMTRSIYI